MGLRRKKTEIEIGYCYFKVLNPHETVPECWQFCSQMKREDEEHEHQIFRGQIAYATIIQTDKCSILGLGVGLSISKYQIFRGQIAYAMIIQMDKCAFWGLREGLSISKYQIFRG